MRLPLEILKEKYIPITEIPEKYGISIYQVKNLIKSRKIRYAEFRAPGDHRRTVHVNPEDVIAALEEEKSDEPDTLGRSLT